MAKEINIHIKTPGAKRAKQNVDDLDQSTRKYGNTVRRSQSKGGKHADKTTSKLKKQDSVMKSLATSAKSLVVAWLSLETVKRIITYIANEFERMAAAVEKISNADIAIAGVGQALEFQTGTVGQQRFWTKEATELQKAGAFQDTSAAKDMLVAMDIAFSSQGGIKNEAIRNLGKQLAPMFGAAGLDGSQMSQIMEFGTTAGIAPNADAYKDYFAKLRAGFSSSNATDFGSFMTALQKGGTAYISQGGSLEEAISHFSSARAVTANEMLAANLLEQTSRLSSGAYEKPREAIEKGLGVNWSDLSMDQRTEALLQFVASIPESQRAAKLTELGFPTELASGIGKLITPSAQQTKAATSKNISSAKSSSVDQLINSYLNTDLAKERQSKANIANKIVNEGHKMNRGKRLIDESVAEFELNSATGNTSFLIPDKSEELLGAIQKVNSELWDLLNSGKLNEEQHEKVLNQAVKTSNAISLITNDPATSYFYPVGKLKTEITRGAAIADEVRGGTTINYNYITNYAPTAEDDQSGERVTYDE